MNGGRAASVARRAVAPESAPRPRREAAERAPTREPQERATLVAAPERPPTTRDRMQASFGAGTSRLRREAMRVLAGGAGQATTPAPVARPVVPPVARTTTRDRIVNRALGSPEPGRAPGSATVVDLAEAQSRRQRQPVDEAAPDGTSRPLAPVIVLPVGPTLARPPPEGAAPETVATGASARGPPGAGPAAAAGLDVAAVPEDAAALLGAEAAVGGGPPGAEAPAAPGAPVAGARAVRRGVIRNPGDEPGFQAMKERAQQAGGRAKQHQPGKEGAATAQGASEPDPEKDVLSQVAREQEEAMGLAEPGKFDPLAFKTEVKKAVEGMAPPATLEEADEFKKSGKAGGAAAEIHVIVAGGKETSEHAIETATSAPPDLEKTAKPVSKMVNDAAGQPTPDVGAAAALPGIRPQWMIDLTGGSLLIDAKLAEANVTDEQLVQANEPSFTEVLDTRQDVREHAATAPGEYRAQEEVVLAKGRAGAEDVAAGQLEGIHVARTDTLGAALDVKRDTKSADEQLRDGIHQSIIGIHDRTQTDVMAILSTLDTTVDAMFTAGEKAARDEFERYVAEKMRAYKADRYSGAIGKLKWVKDRFWDLPSTVNAFYRDGRTNYLAAMDRLIEVIAITVGVLLGLAHARILMGREEVRTFVAGLDESVQTLGAETAADLDNRFDQLASDVDAKRDELVDAVARKYVESRDALDERIEELKEATKGLVKKAVEAAIRVIKTIAELTKLLFRVLLKAASAIGDIVAHPIRFLESLVRAVKGGLERFVSRIGTHLQNSLLDLLFGELGKSGITMPAQLDFAGILDLVLQVLGLTYANIRERVVKRFGEPVVAEMEQTVDVFKTLVKDGVAGLWTWIREKLTDLEDIVVGKIKTYVIERVVEAGIGYIMALLNPAAAFIKACQGIYKIVMFVVERAKQIAEFVDAILDSIGAIARGDVGGAIEKIENALAGGLTLAINFLARLANLGALSEKIRSIIGLVRKPIMRVVDGIVFGAGEIFRRTLGPALAFGKAKVQSGKEFLRGKTQAVRDRLKRPAETVEPAPPAAEDGRVAAPAPLRDEAGPGPLVVYEAFSSEGHTHELYTGAGGKELIVSTDPTPITNIGDPALNALHDDYVAARVRYDRALTELAALPPDQPGRTGWTTIKAGIDAIVDRIVDRIRQLRLDDSPGASAPGIGDIRLHGQQQKRMESGPPVWTLESEHLMPFAIGKMLWDTVGQLIPGRGGFEDKEQTTIMLYEPAADEKTTSHDSAAISRFKSHYIDNLQDAIAEMRERARVQDVRRVGEAARDDFKDAYAKVLGGMANESAAAERVTNAAVRNEHARADATEQTNGARRAERDPLPSPTRVEEAADQQYDNVVDLAREVVEASRPRW